MAAGRGKGAGRAVATGGAGQHRSPIRSPAEVRSPLGSLTELRSQLRPPAEVSDEPGDCRGERREAGQRETEQLDQLQEYVYVRMYDVRQCDTFLLACVLLTYLFIYLQQRVGWHAVVAQVVATPPRRLLV